MIPNLGFNISDVGILCPGPSLNRFLEAPVAHGCVIGVNQAATAWACDWWSFGDAAAFERFEPIGRPRIFTTKKSREATPISSGPRSHEGTEDGDPTHEECGTECPSDLRWRDFSMTAAMVLAELVGATRVTLYGADLCGAEYFRPGAKAPADHSAYRWINERHRYSRVKGWMESRGVIVERVRVEGFEQAEA